MNRIVVLLLSLCTMSMSAGAAELEFKDRCFVELMGVERNYLLLFFEHHPTEKWQKISKDPSKLLRLDEGELTLEEIGQRLHYLKSQFRYNESVEISDEGDRLVVTISLIFRDVMLSQRIAFSARDPRSVEVRLTTFTNQLDSGDKCDWSLYP